MKTIFSLMHTHRYIIYNLCNFVSVNVIVIAQCYISVLFLFYVFCLPLSSIDRYLFFCVFVVVYSQSSSIIIIIVILSIYISFACVSLSALPAYLLTAITRMYSDVRVSVEKEEQGILVAVVVAMLIVAATASLSSSSSSEALSINLPD